MPTELRYILLARHGAANHDPDKADKNQSLKDGKDVKDVAFSLTELLSDQPENERIVIGEIWRGSYQQGRETADILHKAVVDSGFDIAGEQFVQKEALNPKQFWRAEGLDDRRKVGEDLLTELKCLCTATDASQAGANAILVVGHAPHLGWIAEDILRRPTPIARAELVCIAISDTQSDRLLRRVLVDKLNQVRTTKLLAKARVLDSIARSLSDLSIRRDRWLLWTIAPTDDKTTEQLREKIESKKQLAGVLGSVITVLLGFLLGVTKPTSTPEAKAITNSIDSIDVWRTCFFLSLAFFLVALGLYLATLYAYDRLLMPVRFWAESANLKDRRWLVKRPPSSETWVLYQNMIRVWNWMFTPATWAVVFGILFLAAAVFHPDQVTALVAVGLLVLFAGYYRYFRPTLGTED